MVYGIEKFKDYFGAHLDRYVIIGGTACNMIYAQYGAQERATQGIDMIIVAEAFLGARPWDDNMMRNLRLPMTADEMADHIRAIYLG